MAQLIQNNIMSIAIVALVIINGRNSRIQIPAAKSFRPLCVHLLVLLALDCATWFLNGKIFSGAYPLALAGNYAYYGEQAILCYSWSVYALQVTDTRLTPKGVWLHRIPVLAALLFVLANPLTKAVFMIGPDNVYGRGWGIGGIIYTLCAFYYLAETMVLAAFRLIRSPHGESRDSRNLLFTSVLPIFGALVQLFFYGVSTTWSFGALGILVLYLNVQSRCAAKAQRKLEQGRIAIMLSQIQPHFLYNSLVGIKEMCDTGEQQTASQALEHFAYYLRGNLDSLSGQPLIVFSKEVSHVKDYLYLEKLRFEEKLHIVWELNFTDFLIPPLTLQPIAENAVRHGLTKKRRGGTLTIRSDKTEDKIIITVQDDGVGFDVNEAADDDRTHIGIENVRNRLQTQCRGDLLIESAPGTGTWVKLILPVKKEIFDEYYCG